MNAQALVLRDKVLAHSDHLSVAVAKALNRIGDIQQDMHQTLGSLSADAGRKLLQARRMIGALERRLDELTVLLTEGTEDSVYSAFRLAQAPIPVPHDAVNALLTEQPLPPINPLSARRDIEVLLNSITFTKVKKAAY